MAGSRILYEYIYDKTKDVEVNIEISYQENTVKVYEQDGYPKYGKKEEVLKHTLKISDKEPAGITIYCGKKWFSMGSMSFSLSSDEFKSVIITEENEKYITINLKFR